MKSFVLAITLSLIPLLHAQEDSAADIQHRIQKIVIPSLSFKNRSVDEALQILREKSVELDGDIDVERRGVHFIFVPQNGADTGADGLQATAAKIDYSGRDVTLEAVLREVFSPTYDVFVTSVGIVVCPKGTEPFPNSKARTGEILEKIS